MHAAPQDSSENAGDLKSRVYVKQLAEAETRAICAEGNHRMLFAFGSRSSCGSDPPPTRREIVAHT